jgi:hypothetical protein
MLQLIERERKIDDSFRRISSDVPSISADLSPFDPGFHHA